MAQTSVSTTYQGSGVPGEFYSSAPHRTQSKIISSTTEANNIPGAVVFQDSSDDNYVATDNSSGVIAGVLGFPKAMVRDSLDDDGHAENDTVVEIIQQGYVYIDLPDAASIGDSVYVSDSDGTTLEIVAPTGSASTDYSFVGKVARSSISAAGTGIVYLDLEI